MEWSRLEKSSNPCAFRIDVPANETRTESKNTPSSCIVFDFILMLFLVGVEVGVLFGLVWFS